MKKRIAKATALWLAAVMTVTPSLHTLAQEASPEAVCESLLLLEETQESSENESMEESLEVISEEDAEEIAETEERSDEETEEENKEETEEAEDIPGETEEEISEAVSEDESQEAMTEAPEDETREVSGDESAEVPEEIVTEEKAPLQGAPEKKADTVTAPAAKEDTFADVIRTMADSSNDENLIRVCKEDGTEFKMFVVSGSSCTVNGEGMLVTITTANTGYNALTFGKTEDEDKRVFEGSELPDGGFSFSFAVPLSYAGTDVPVLLRSKSTGAWYTKQVLTMTFPAVKDGEEKDPEEKDPEEKDPEEKDPEENPSMPEQGIYSAQASTGSAMFKVIDTVLTVKGGKMTAVITLSGTGYDYLYMGSKAEAFAASEEEWIPAVVNEAGKYTYEIPVEKLDEPMAVASRSARYAQEGKGEDAWLDRQITISSEGLEKVGEVKNIPEDGIYEAAAATNAAMFKVTKTVLTVKNGVMTAVVTLSGKGYDYLYPGNKEAAFSDAEENWIPAVVAEDGYYTYEIPVSELDVPMAFASRSARYAEEGRGVDAWIDREITISSEDLLKIGEVTENKDPEEGGNGDNNNTNNNNNNNNNGNKPGNQSGSNTNGGTGANGGTVTTIPEGNDGKEEEESGYVSDTSGSTSAVNSSTSLKDGVYTPDAFSWSGGTGKVNLLCNKVTVKNGQAYATIAFTSSSYAYVKANGRTYYSSVSGGKSIVTIPVELNKNQKILGMTTKMSAAHEIEYSIFVYLAAAQGGSASGMENGGMISSSNEELDDEAPVIMGLALAEEEEKEHSYAEYFRIYHYEDGIVLLEIDMTRGTARDPEKLKEAEEVLSEASEDDPEEAEKEKKQNEYDEDGALIVETPEERIASLYMANVVKYLIVPESVQIPAGLDKEMIVINQKEEPSFAAFAASEAALFSMNELGLLGQIAALAFPEEEITYQELKDALAETEKKSEDKNAVVKEGLFLAGTLKEPDFKTLIMREVDLALMDGSILPRDPEEEDTQESFSEEEVLTPEEQLEGLKELVDHFSVLGIPMLVDRSEDEENEIAAYEWIRVYGVIFGLEKEADVLFDKAADQWEKHN